ncbi:hypothetical protein SNE40_015796 [Patella caerulea]|uniref:Ribosomal protein mS38 C-terminal domain-containing protein n=1 Tax=Patella caerulea TaxID=87958 RepID=A0AAN8JPW4_PATCE
MTSQRSMSVFSAVCKNFHLLRLTTSTGIKPNIKSVSSVVRCDKRNKTDISFNIPKYTNSNPATSLNKITSPSFKLSAVINNTEYVCPTSKSNVNVVILDRNIVERQYDCPTSIQTVQDIIAPHVNKINVTTPPPNTNDTTGKFARNIMKIRRRKMNKHLLKKFRKANLFKLRIQTQQLKKKKERIFAAHLATYTKAAKDFDAEEFIKSELELARRGGFYVDVLGNRNLKSDKV